MKSEEECCGTPREDGADGNHARAAELIGRHGNGTTSRGGFAAAARPLHLEPSQP